MTSLIWERNIHQYARDQTHNLVMGPGQELNLLTSQYTVFDSTNWGTHTRFHWVFNIHPGPSPWLPFSKTSATIPASVLGCWALSDRSFFKRGCVSELKENFHGKLCILYSGWCGSVEVVDLILGQGSCPGCRLDPWSGCRWKTTNHDSLSLSSSL